VREKLPASADAPPRSYAAVFLGASRIASGGKSGEVRLWDADAGDLLQILPAHFTHVAGLAVNRDLTLLASAGWDCAAKLHALRLDVRSPGLRSRTDLPQNLDATANSSAAGDDEDSPAPAIDTLATLAHADWVWSVEFTKEAVQVCWLVARAGRWLASLATDFSLSVWRRTHAAWDGCQRLVTGTDSGAVRIWACAAPYECMGVVDGHRMAVYALSAAAPDLLLTAGLDALPKLHRLPRTHTKLVLDKPVGHEAAVRAACFVRNQDQARLAFTAGQGMSAGPGADRASANPPRADKTIKVWDLDSGALVATLRGHELPVTDLVVSADSRRVMSLDEDAAMTWDTVTLEVNKGVGQLLLCCVCGAGNKWKSHALVVSKAEAAVELGNMHVGLTMVGALRLLPRWCGCTLCRPAR
jgi:WD40 repeat protein